MEAPENVASKSETETAVAKDAVEVRQVLPQLFPVLVFLLAFISESH
jgi:hypothetical protein